MQPSLQDTHIHQRLAPSWGPRFIIFSRKRTLENGICKINIFLKVSQDTCYWNSAHVLSLFSPHQRMTVGREKRENQNQMRWYFLPLLEPHPCWTYLSKREEIVRDWKDGVRFQQVTKEGSVSFLKFFILSFAESGLILNFMFSFFGGGGSKINTHNITSNLPQIMSYLHWINIYNIDLQSAGIISAQVR